MLTRICTLPPRLAAYLVGSFSSPGDRVLDPFCGKGTVPLQACLMGRIGIGADISPEAVCASKALVRAPELSVIDSAIADLSVAVARLLRGSELVPELAVQPRAVTQLYHPETLREIIAWRRVLHRDRRDTTAFLRGLMLGILHGKGNDFLSLRCSHSYSMSPGYVARYVAEHGLTAPRRAVAQCLLNRARLVLQDGGPPVRGFARLQDARTFPLRTHSVNLILTSPPYFSVHRYARDNWLRLWFLGYEDYRTVQRSLIQTSDVTLYRRHMRKALARMYAILVPKGHVLLLVGDVRLRRRGGRQKLIPTAQLLAQDARAEGFHCEGILSDSIPHARKVAGYMAAEGGITTERLLVLRR